VLSACEAAKKAVIANLRRRALDFCTTREGDIAFSDYPLRALMPIEVVRQKLTPNTAQHKQDLEKQIANLQAAYAARRAPFVPPCSTTPNQLPCIAIRNRIASLQRELDLFLADNESRDLAESRYAFWVETISRARADEGLINGYLSISELAMYRREIYCQYGISPDTAGCPKVPLSNLLADGNVLKKVQQMKLSDMTSAPKNTSAEAWDDLQSQVLRRVAEAVNEKPHYFELLNPIYTPGNAPGKPDTKTFTLHADVLITFFDNDVAQFQSLLTAP